MKPCKEKPTDGKLCPNKVDEGQEYCPYHLAKQDAKEKKFISSIMLAVGTAGIVKFAPKVFPKVFENVIASFLPKKQ